ncbi:MAG: ATP-binding cassette domain-containing protein [Gammaproteobacteria bacterium]|nr:ATP-binding cassette domain-containing protein [Gammaproteobacteria bacterium]
MSNKVLSVYAFSKRYGDRLAVDNISFDIEYGEVVGLLGPNGAGKTTTINMILGVLEPSSGSVTIAGKDVATQRAAALAVTNFSASYAPLPGNLSVEQNLRFFGLIYDVKNLSATIQHLLKRFDLLPFRKTKVGVLSSGEQVRVSLAKAMLNRPRLLLLDEPTASLDPNVANQVRTMICDFAKQEAVGVLWTSHNMFEVEKVCDRVLFLSHGKILLTGNPKTLPREHGEQTLEDLFITLAREPLAQTAE